MEKRIYPGTVLCFFGKGVCGMAGKRKKTASARRTGKRILRCFLICLPFYILAGLARLLSIWARTHSSWVEEVFSEKLYPGYAQAVSSVTGIFPFSLAEVLLCLLSTAFVILFFYFLFFRIRRFIPFLCICLAVCSFLYAQYICTWQLHYSRLPYAQIRSYPQAVTDREHLTGLCEDLAQQINLLRDGHAESENGTYLMAETKPEILSMVPDIYAQSSDLFPELDGKYAAPKGVLLSGGLSRLQITGIFIPHTIEANVNRQEVPWAFPFTACHESAHQRGFAREDEANYIAYEACINGDSEDFRYSGLFMGFLYAGNALYKADSEAYFRVYRSLCEGARRDIRAYDEFWSQFEGKPAEIEEKINDTYLKANQQSDGVLSYDRMIELLVARFEKYGSCIDIT